MANIAYYELLAYGTKEGIERFLAITKNRDKEYIIYAFDQSDSYNELIDCGDGRFSMGFFGEVRWGSGFLSEPWGGKEIDQSTGKKVITWLDASKILGLTMEWYCEECGSMFCEYYAVSDGIRLREDTVYWSWPGTFDSDDHRRNIECFESEVEDALGNGISLDMSQVEWIRGNDYEILERIDCFSFGGYRWDWHSEDEISDKVPPVVSRDIRRL